MQTGLSSASLNPRVGAIPVSDEPAVEASADRARSLRHRASVRVTHWIFATGVLGLIVSGGGILISHPRFYWGETGSVFTPALIALPLPMIIGPSLTLLNSPRTLPGVRRRDDYSRGRVPNVRAFSCVVLLTSLMGHSVSERLGMVGTCSNDVVAANQDA